MTRISLQGLNELVVDLNTEAVDAPGRARKVIQTHSQDIKTTMKSFAPVNEGTMRDSISYETKVHPGGAEGEIGPTATRDGFPYPAAIEWGTAKMAPQAFAGPALDRHSGAFVADMLGVCEL